jgi:hypothetical protein
LFKYAGMIIETWTVRYKAEQAEARISWRWSAVTIAQREEFVQRLACRAAFRQRELGSGRQAAAGTPALVGCLGTMHVEVRRADGDGRDGRLVGIQPPGFLGLTLTLPGAAAIDCLSSGDDRL